MDNQPLIAKEASSLVWIRKQISLYYGTEMPVSTILEITLNIMSSDRDVIIEDKVRKAAREHMMKTFHNYLSREYLLPYPVRIEWMSKKKGYVHFITRSARPEPVKCMFMRAVVEAVNAHLRRDLARDQALHQPSYRNISKMSVNFLLSKPLDYQYAPNMAVLPMVEEDEDANEEAEDEEDEEAWEAYPQ